jgi:hypothetical protein
MKTVVRGLVALAVIFIVGNAAHGLTFTVSGHGDATNKTLSAPATFAVTNLQLIITLSNTASFDPNDSADILTGIFFQMAGDPALTRTSALLGPDTAIKCFARGTL